MQMGGSSVAMEWSVVSSQLSVGKWTMWPMGEVCTDRIACGVLCVACRKVDACGWVLRVVGGKGAKKDLKRPENLKLLARISG
jgi:hypothetical protein